MDQLPNEILLNIAMYDDTIKVEDVDINPQYVIEEIKQLDPSFDLLIYLHKLIAEKKRISELMNSRVGILHSIIRGKEWTIERNPHTYMEVHDLSENDKEKLMKHFNILGYDDSDQTICIFFGEPYLSNDEQHDLQELENIYNPVKRETQLDFTMSNN